MKITKKIKDYIIDREMPVFDNMYVHILQNKTEKLLLSLPLSTINQVVEIIDVNSTIIPYLLPGAGKPLAATYKLGISKAEEDVGTKLTA